MPNVKILIVEDETMTAEDIKKKLEKLEYIVVDCVMTGEDAIRKAGETQPDLVLMDIKLKGKIDGIEAAEYIRARLDVPVIYLTVYTDEETLDRAKTTTPYGYIVKPFREENLYTTIEIALHRYNVEKSGRG